MNNPIFFFLELQQFKKHFNFFLLNIQNYFNFTIYHFIFIRIELSPLKDTFRYAHNHQIIQIF
jgi:hypothetical protein